MPMRLCVSLALCLLTLVRIDARQQPADRVLSDDDRQVLEVVLSGNRMRAPVLDLTWPMCGERGVVGIAADVRASQSPCFSPGEWTDRRMWPGVVDVEALRVALSDRNAVSWRFGTWSAYPTLPGGEAPPALVLRSMSQLTSAYPDLRTVVLVGAPGFSADRRRALVYLESRCTSGACSEGNMMLVERDGTRWRARGLWGWGSGA